MTTTPTQDTSDSATTAIAASDPFHREITHSLRLDALSQRVYQARLQSLAKLRDHLASRILSYLEIFGERQVLSSCGDQERVREITRGDYLYSWEQKGEDFHAQLRYSFRNEINSYDIVFPMRYLAANGIAIMRADALLQEQEEARKQEALAAEKKRKSEANDRATLKRLLKKFPNEARQGLAASALASPDPEADADSQG